MTQKPEATRVPERFGLAACGDRWLAFSQLAHETLPCVAGVARGGDELLVRREPPPGSPLSRARVPRHLRAPLLLQAASAAVFFGSRGFALTGRDLDDARWARSGESALLWLSRTPEAVADPRVSAGIASTLAAFLGRLFGDRITRPAAKRLQGQLLAGGADDRRGEFWIASILREFSELSRPEAAPARQRCLGICGEWLQSAHARGLREEARAIRDGREPRLFAATASALTAGAALRLEGSPSSGSEASRALRESAERDATGRTARWIAVAPEGWDALSRRAFASARLALGDRIEVVEVPVDTAAPKTADQWREQLWVPGGTVAGSVRLYEWLAEAARMHPTRARALPLHLLASPEWAAFAADPTGHASLPDAGSAAPPVGVNASVPGARSRSAAEDRGRRVELLVGAGRIDAALEEARRWIGAAGEGGLERWFGVAAFLSACVDGRFVPWLEAIEAEREIAGGRPREAGERLTRLARAEQSSAEERRHAALRLAEVSAILGRPGEAARRAAVWRRAHPEAPPGESVRALRLGAVGLSREGRTDCAVGLLDEAERLGVDLSAAERLEIALARAQVRAAAGQFDEESRVYDEARPAALAHGDSLAARFLAQEARGLLDRRDYGRAALRLEEALAATRDDPAERAALLLDLAATRYHAGEAARAEALLEECLGAAAAAGREDLARTARGNRVELLINRGAWAEASEEIDALERSAKEDRDDTRLLVARHHRSRLALRRGFLASAARDNAEARRLAAALGDRLEIGELWIEEGDRLLYEGERDRAREAWRRAAADPPDRSGRDGLARRRLEELDWEARGEPPAEALAALDALFSADGYSAAETVARWLRILPADAVPAETRARAESILRNEGGAALADRIFGRGEPRVVSEALRRIRASIAAVREGGAPDAGAALEAIGVCGLAVLDADGSELVRLGTAPAGEGPRSERALEAGAARFRLVVWPPPADGIESALALLLETLLFRAPPAPTAADPEGGWADGWRRLGVVTADSSMEEPYRRLARFAPQSVTVLVLGESGSGKEAVARAIHRLSPRAAGPFVAVNVPAIPPALTESELFGHTRGAFTGADRERRGLLEEAMGGTIFFDEVGDLAPPLQAKLLRSLQEREIRRVGENRARSIDVRVVSATSRDLAKDVEAGHFREDLYYRLHVAVIRLPALRERGRDAVLLARHFLCRFAREYGRGELRLTPEASARIAAFSWPGNVRELQNAMAQAAALSEPDTAVGEAILPETLRGAGRRTGSRGGDYRTRMDAHRRDMIADALEAAGGNRSRAARELGLSRQALLYLIKELKVEGRPRT